MFFPDDRSLLLCRVIKVPDQPEALCFQIRGAAPPYIYAVGRGEPGGGGEDLYRERELPEGDLPPWPEYAQASQTLARECTITLGLTFSAQSQDLQM